MNHHLLATQLLALPEFRVIAWIDTGFEAGIAADSDDALVVLCPILGPSATLILHRLSRYASGGPTVWAPSEFARTFGLASAESTVKAAKAVARLAQFGFVTVRDNTLAVRTKVPPVPQRWLQRVPDYLRSDLAAAG